MQPTRHALAALFLCAIIPLTMAQPRQDGADACADAVQGEIAWNYDGNRNWATQNVRKLCSEAPGSVQPARCFERVMHGGVNWGGGSRWQWENAVALCRGTRDAEATVTCFEEHIANGVGWREATDSCQWDRQGHGAVAGREQADPPRVEARRIEPGAQHSQRPRVQVDPAAGSDNGGAPEREARRINPNQQQGRRHVVRVAPSGDKAATGQRSEPRGEWGWIKADSGLCLTLNVFDRPLSTGEKIKKGLKKAFDPREHAKALAGAAGAGLVFGPGGPELVHSIQALRQAKKVRDGWKGDLRHSMGATLLECGSVAEKYQAFRREGRFFEVGSGHCFKGKQGQAGRNGGRVQLGKCKKQKRTAWYMNGRQFRNGKGKCLDVHRPDRDKEGARVQLWECNGEPQQRWTYTGD